MSGRPHKSSNEYLSAGRKRLKASLIETIAKSFNYRSGDGPVFLYDPIAGFGKTHATTEACVETIVDRLRYVKSENERRWLEYQQHTAAYEAGETLFRMEPPDFEPLPQIVFATDKQSTVDQVEKWIKSAIAKIPAEDRPTLLRWLSPSSFKVDKHNQPLLDEAGQPITYCAFPDDVSLCVEEGQSPLNRLCMPLDKDGNPVPCVHINTCLVGKARFTPRETEQDYPDIIIMTTAMLVQAVRSGPVPPVRHGRVLIADENPLSIMLGSDGVTLEKDALSVLMPEFLATVTPNLITEQTYNYTTLNTLLLKSEKFDIRNKLLAEIEAVRREAFEEFEDRPSVCESGPSRCQHSGTPRKDYLGQLSGSRLMSIVGLAGALYDWIYSKDFTSAFFSVKLNNGPSAPDKFASLRWEPRHYIQPAWACRPNHVRQERWKELVRETFSELPETPENRELCKKALDSINETDFVPLICTTATPGELADFKAIFQVVKPPQVLTVNKFGFPAEEVPKPTGLLDALSQPPKPDGAVHVFKKQGQLFTPNIEHTLRIGDFQPEGLIAIQIFDRTVKDGHTSKSWFSKTAITNDPGRIAALADFCIRELKYVQGVTQDPRVHVITHKDLLASFKEKLRASSGHHFGGGQGSNQYINLKSYVIVGAKNIGEHDILRAFERLHGKTIEAMEHHDIAEVQSLQDYMNVRTNLARYEDRTFERTHRYGSFEYAIRQPVHEALRLFMQHMVDDAQYQDGVGRIRPHMLEATDPALAVILSNRPTRYARYCAEAEDIWNLGLDRITGVRCDSNRGFAILMPELFKDEKSVEYERAMGRLNKPGKENEFLKISFRVKKDGVNHDHFYHAFIHKSHGNPFTFARRKAALNGLELEFDFTDAITEWLSKRAEPFTMSELCLALGIGKMDAGQDRATGGLISAAGWTRRQRVRNGERYSYWRGVGT